MFSYRKSKQFKIGDKIIEKKDGFRQNILTVEYISYTGTIKASADNGKYIISGPFNMFELYTSFKVGDRVRIKQLDIDSHRPCELGTIDSKGFHEGWLIKPDGYSFCWNYLEHEIELLVDASSQPLRCSCGCWSAYGKDCNKEFHSDKCDLITGNNSF